MTPLDRAHAAMQSGDDSDRLFYFELLADTELILWLDDESDGQTANPVTMTSEGKDYVLAFDHETRLADMAGQATDYMTLPGRALAGMLAGQGVGLGLNLGNDSAMLLPPDALDWLVTALSGAGAQPAIIDRPAQIGQPGATAPLLAARLGAKLAHAGDTAGDVFLTGADATRHLLCFVGANPEAEQVLANTVAGAMAFTGDIFGPVDVAFMAAEDPMAAHVRTVGHRVALPEAEPAISPAAPGMDPDKPPRLR